MRFADLLQLSLAALWQQKLRALLTTLGVVFGAFVLVFSLSLGQGVQSTIARESHRTEFLRRIIVHPGWGGAELSKEETPLAGDMNDDRRQRLQKALHERREQYSARGPRVALTQERLQALRELEHVVSVTPLVQQQGYALLGKHAESVWTCGADPDYARYQQRLIAGDFFHSPNERRVVISELTCYLLGVTSDADLQRLIGQPLRLRFQKQSAAIGLQMYLYKGNGSPNSLQENSAVAKVKGQLPAALGHFDLTAEERNVLLQALRAPPAAETVYNEDFTIAGVLRLPTLEEQEQRWDSLNREADILLPRQTAEEVFWRQQQGAESGVSEATIQVDREENVKAVLARTQEMKLQTYAPIEYIERERLIYLLIFTAMTCVAAVALLVAALGIANTMLMSVLERTREIGIFKAVGAGDGTVQLIFLIEGAFIGLIGGGAGLLLGWAVSFPADAWVRALVSRDLKIELKESLFVFPWWLTVSVVLFAVVVTTLAAVFPARRAARINPVSALRTE